jgi:hypothetical protein
VTRRSTARKPKLKVTYEALKDQCNIREITSEFGVHPEKVLQWKQYLMNALPGELFPPLEYPEISVHTAYPGALPEEVKQNVICIF